MKTLAAVQMVLGLMVVVACSVFLANVNDYSPGMPRPLCVDYDFTIFLALFLGISVIALFLGISVMGVGLAQLLKARKL